MRVEVTFDHTEWDPLLAAWQEPAVRHALRGAASAFGQAAAPIVRSEVPSARPGNRYAGTAGNLRRLTRYALLKRGIGVVIGPMGKGAFYRGMVTSGTKPHAIRPRRPGGRLIGGRLVIRHPGSRPNDYIGRALGRATSAGFAKAEGVIFDSLEGKRVVGIG